MKVMINLSGINKLQLGNNTQKVKQRFTKKCGNTLRSKVIKRTPVDHGQLRKSWDLTITEKEVILQNNKDYAMYKQEQVFMVHVKLQFFLNLLHFFNLKLMVKLFDVLVLKE